MKNARKRRAGCILLQSKTRNPRCDIFMSSTPNEPIKADSHAEVSASNPRALRAEHERLNLALSSARMGTWDWHVEGRSMQWDERMHALFGLPNGAFGGRYEDFLNLLRADDRERVAREITASLSTCSDYDGEFHVISPADGSVHTLRARAQVHCDENNTPERVVGVCWDISERKRTEESLARNQSFLATLMSHLPDHIYFKDLDSRFLAVNESKAKRCGRNDPAELLGKTDFDFFSSEHAQQAMEDEREIIRTGNPVVNLEEKETWPDGSETWVSTTKLPLRDSRGQVIGTFGLSRDITERKRTENQLARFTEELRAKNEALEEELTMARELQNAMLPQYYPRFPRGARAEESAVRFFHIYRPSTAVSGDFFDVFEIEQNLAGLFICDVMGHGVRAALVAATMRALVGELRAVWNDPAKFLTELNQALRRTLRHARTPLFASAFYMAADLARKEIHYANAGHPLPLRLHRAEINGDFDAASSDEKPQPLNGCKPGPVLGLFDDAHYQNCHASLQTQDTILLFTDGLFEVEGSGGEFYDYAKLLNAVSRRSNLATDQLCRGVVEEVQAFSESKEFNDDVCLVAMEVKQLPQDEV